MSSLKRGKSGVAFFEKSSWGHRYKVINENGKIEYKKKKGFKTEESAIESYYAYEEQYKKQATEYFITVNKDIIFKDYLKYWFENIFSERIETTTKMVGSYIVYDLIIPNIQYDIKVNLVTTDYLNEIIKSAAGISNNSAIAARGYIIMAMKDAVTGGYIRTNPALNTYRYYREKPKIRVFSIRQMKKFLNFAKSYDWYLEILLGLFCGFRKGEILGLKFSDINLDDKIISITRQLSPEYEMEKGTNKVKLRRLVEKEPKTPNSVRNIKAPDIVIEELIKRKNQIEKDKLIEKEKYYDNDYISCRHNGKPHDMSALYQHIKKICKALNLPPITVHGLRHMSATILLEQGVSLARISAFLGHKSIHTTFNYYCEVMDEKNNILNFMNEIYAVGES